MVDETQDVWVCATCGVEYPPGPEPERCPICEDERQYVPAGGQRWTTLAQLARDGASVEIAEVEPDLWSLHAAGVGIAQAGMLVRTPARNLLFDVRASSTTRRSRGSVSWAGSRTSSRDQIGGHFVGSTMAHWQAGAQGRGVLFAGDAIFPKPDGMVTFMRSYPNMIPLSAAVVRRLAAHASRYDFDTLFNNFGSSVGPGAADIVRRLAERYAAWVSGENDHLT